MRGASAHQRVSRLGRHRYPSRSRGLIRAAARRGPLCGASQHQARVGVAAANEKRLERRNHQCLAALIDHHALHVSAPLRHRTHIPVFGFALSREKFFITSERNECSFLQTNQYKKMIWTKTEHREWTLARLLRRNFQPSTPCNVRNGTGGKEPNLFLVGDVRA